MNSLKKGKLIKKLSNGKRVKKENDKKGFQDAIYELVSNPKKRIELFQSISVNNQGFVLLSLSKHLQQDILEKLNDKDIIAFLHFLDPDEVTDLLQNVDPRRRKKIISNLSNHIGEKVKFLLRFSPKIAAGIMSLDYVEVEKHTTFEEVSSLIQKHMKRTGKVPTILIVENGFLKGELPGHVLALQRPKEKVGKYTKRVVSVKYDREEMDVIHIFKRNPHNRVVVLDDDKSIMGVIHSDDLLQVLHREPATSLLGFAGVSDEENVHDPIVKKVKHRYQWLILNLATAFLAASVVALFQDTISKYVLLAVYMPIIAGMGGNTGTQTLAVLVRGIALKEVELRTGSQIIVREMSAGAINGMINGVLVAAVATLFNHTPMLGLIVGISMVINLSIAGFFGSLIPLIMKRLGKDPATSATIFITTATDLCGFFVFLWLATIVL